MIDKPQVAAHAENLLGEGALWSAADRRVMWTDIIGKRLWTYDPATSASQSLALPSRLACFAPLGGSTILAGFAEGLERLDWTSGQREPVAPIEPDLPTTRVNDGKLDRRGRLVFGTMDEAQDGAKPIGSVWSYDGRSPPRALFGGVCISNSIAFSPYGRTMYFADTPTRTILAFDYDLDEGRVSNRRVFAATDVGYPDGSTVDADGCLWNAEWDGARVVRYRPDGRIDRVIALPCARVTCCAFGGPNLSTLYVTSARVGLDGAALAAQPLAGALFAVQVGVLGLADAPFAGPSVDGSVA